MIDKNFLRLYKESIYCKDAGMLKSALAKREAATERMKHDKGRSETGIAEKKRPKSSIGCIMAIIIMIITGIIAAIKF